MASRHQTEISADVARSPEACGIINGGREGECGELADPRNAHQPAASVGCSDHPSYVPSIATTAASTAARAATSPRMAADKPGMPSLACSACLMSEETHDTSSRRRLVQRREGDDGEHAGDRRRYFCRNCIVSTRSLSANLARCFAAQSPTRLSEPQFGQSQQARMLGEREVGFRAFSYPTDGRPSRPPRPLRLDLFLLPGCSGRADEIRC